MQIFIFEYTYFFENLCKTKYSLMTQKSAASLELDVGEDRILLQTRSNVYHLDIWLPQNIVQEECGAQFNRQTKVKHIQPPHVKCLLPHYNGQCCQNILYLKYYTLIWQSVIIILYLYFFFSQILHKYSIIG